MGRSTDLSRVVSHALRHEPWLYEIELDDQGWTDIDTLVAALRLERRWRDVSRGEIENMVVDAAKSRYEAREGRIRARYGHSVPQRLQMLREQPPDQLFHGTSAAAARLIGIEGLRPMGRQYVHLSIDRATATTVARRKSAVPVILIVDAARAAAQAGVAFFVGNKRVWLADAIPAQFVTTAPPSEAPGDPELPAGNLEP